MAATRRKPVKRTRARRAGTTGRAAKAPRRTWSRDVMERSDALDLQRGVFKLRPREMARSLKRSAERSTRRKSSPFRSAMSMLTFFENRAGRTLPAARKKAIQQAKQELRKLFGREPASS
jgi:hypothetical protein